MTDSNATPKREPEFVNVRELAALLRVSPISIYRMVERRSIPFHRLPRGLRFEREDIEAYLQKCRVESVVTTPYERKEDPR